MNPTDAPLTAPRPMPWWFVAAAGILLAGTTAAVVARLLVGLSA